jgi:predicted secreted protein
VSRIRYEINGHECSDLLNIPPHISGGDVGRFAHMVHQVIMAAKKTGDVSVDSLMRCRDTNQDGSTLLRAAGFHRQHIARSGCCLVVTMADRACWSELTAGDTPHSLKSTARDNIVEVRGPIKIRHNFKNRTTSLTPIQKPSTTLGGGKYRNSPKKKLTKKHAHINPNQESPDNIPKRRRRVLARVITLRN